MTVRRPVQKIFLVSPISNSKADERKQEKRNRSPDRAHAECSAQKSGNHSADEEKYNHGKMHLPAERSFIVVIPDRLHEIAPGLTDMIRHKRRRHGNSFVLPEGIELHGADKIEADLTDLIRSGLWKRSQENAHRDLKSDQNRVPPEPPELFYFFGERLRYDRSKEIRRDRDDQIEGPPPVVRPDCHREQYDICRLRVAENTTPNRIGVGTVKSADQNQRPENPVFFALEKKILIFHDSS